MPKMHTIEITDGQRRVANNFLRKTEMDEHQE